MLLRVLNQEMEAPADFQPQNNSQAYLAYAAGIITDASLLPTPLTIEQALLKEYCLNGGGGGPELPELTNPATAAQILAGYEAIDQNGAMMTGTNDAEEQNLRLEGRLSGNGTIGKEWEITDASGLFYMGARQDVASELLRRCKNLTDLREMFLYSTFETLPDLSDISGKQLTGIYGMFNYCERLVHADISKFDTTLITDISSLFNSCKKLNSFKLSDTGFPNLERATNTFSGCESLETIDISFLEGNSKLVSIQNMFSGCKKLRKIDFSKVDTSNVYNIGGWCINCLLLEEIIGFSACNKEGISNAILITYYSSTPAILSRLTFRTDLPEGQYAIRSAIDIKYCGFRRAGLVEMFNTLTDVSGFTYSDNYKKITITGNPCLLTEKEISSNNTTFDTYGSLVDLVKPLASGYYPLEMPVDYRPSGQTTGIEGVLGDITPEMFETGPVWVGLKPYTFPIPEEDKLTDEDRAIATAKGWILVE